MQWRLALRPVEKSADPAPRRNPGDRSPIGVRHALSAGLDQTFGEACPEQGGAYPSLLAGLAQESSPALADS